MVGGRGRSQNNYKSFEDNHWAGCALCESRSLPLQYSRPWIWSSSSRAQLHILSLSFFLNMCIYSRFLTGWLADWIYWLIHSFINSLIHSTFALLSFWNTFLALLGLQGKKSLFFLPLFLYKLVSETTSFIMFSLILPVI